MDRRRKLKYGIFAGIAAVILIACVAAVFLFIQKANKTRYVQSSASSAEKDTAVGLQYDTEAQNKETEKNTDTSVSSEASSEEIQSEDNTDGSNTKENDELETGTPSGEPSAPSGSGQSALERARSILSGMSVEEKVGQMFIARCPSRAPRRKLLIIIWEDTYCLVVIFRGKPKNRLSVIFRAIRTLRAFRCL